MSAPPPLSVGSTFGAYRIDAVLGRGGMGVVYRAQDQRLGRRVALKLLSEQMAADAHFRDRFLRESRLAAAIEHPGVVPIYEAGAVDGRLYIAMRYVEGSDLATLLSSEGALTPDRAVDLVGQLADALDAAHGRGLIHRDVKPSNALVARERGGERVYLVDFGITQDLGSEEKLTETGVMVGTVDYLAPERSAGVSPILGGRNGGVTRLGSASERRPGELRERLTRRHAAGPQAAVHEQHRWLRVPRQPQADLADAVAHPAVRQADDHGRGVLRRGEHALGTGRDEHGLAEHAGGTLQRQGGAREQPARVPTTAGGGLHAGQSQRYAACLREPGGELENGA